MKSTDLKLSICIATFNRGRFIAETLDSIIPQIDSSVELIVVDGASSDNTFEIMSGYLQNYPEIKYYREEINSGVDVDYDKAVSYAKGDYCWLFSDDDLMKPGAVLAVLKSIRESFSEVIVVNSEVRNIDFSEVYMERLLDFSQDKKYSSSEAESFFKDMASYLSFIGAVVIKRQTWLARDRESYYGSLFIHVGVIFQAPPLVKATIIANPFIMIRYGNAMWSARAFEIWTFKWPNLIWSFISFSDESKAKITSREPRKNLSRLFRNRALGAFSSEEIHNLWPNKASALELLMAHLIAVFPRALANILSIIYLLMKKNKNQMALQDLIACKHSSFLSKFFVKTFKIVGMPK